MSNTINLGNFISEYSVRNRAGDDIPVYSVTNKEGYCRDYFSKDVASQDRSTYKIVPRGCFAYNPSRINVGSVDWQHKEDRVIVSPLYVVFSVSKGLDQQYLYYYLKSEKCLYYIKELASGSVRDNLKLSMLKEFTIPNITLEEQRKAVMVLEQTDRLIALQERQMTVLDELVKSRFVEMFGAPITNKMGWPCLSLVKTCKAILGGGTPSKSHPEYFTGGIPWVSPKDMKYAVISDSIDHITEEAVAHSTTNLVPKNSVLMVIRSGILKHTLPVAINSVPVTINQDMKAFVPGNGVITEFLMYYFKAIESDVLAGVRGVTADNIDFKAFQQRTIIVPPLELQNRFAAFVTEVDKSKLAVKQSLEKLETLKKSLMQQYFG